MDASGESGGVTPLTSSWESDEHLPRWSPDGSKIAFIRQLYSDSSDPPLYCDVVPCPTDLFVMNADGTGAQTIGDGGIDDFDWAPDGSKIVYSQAGELWTIRPDGTQNMQLTSTASGPASSEAHPVWSPDGTKIAFQSGSHLFVMNADGTGVSELVDTSNTLTVPDWQPLPVNTPSTYVRPKSATPIRVSLVPAFNACSAPNREHGPPLAFGSCSPPQPGSPRLSLGIGDGNPALARSSGFVRLRVMTGAPGPPNDPDVKVRMGLTNVMHTADRSEYTGELRGELTVRRTDREPGAIGATSFDFPVGFTMPCAATPASSADASNCSTTTTVNALAPGAIRDGDRTIWALDRMRVYDGGPDEDGDTAFDNSLLATQGVFVP